jgi:hypothetical protein
MIKEMDKFLKEQSDAVYELRTDFLRKRMVGDTIAYCREQLVAKKRKGIQLYIKKEYGEAIEVFKNLIPAFKNLLDRYLGYKDDQSAKQTKKDLLHINYNLGSVYLENKNLKDAKTYLEKARDIAKELDGEKADTKYANKLKICEDQLEANNQSENIKKETEESKDAPHP